MASFLIKAGALAGRFRSAAADLAYDMRWSCLPPLMVYFAAGMSGFTGISEAFFVKEKLGPSAALLASLGFWIFRTRPGGRWRNRGAKFKRLKAYFSFSQAP